VVETSFLDADISEGFMASWISLNSLLNKTTSAKAASQSLHSFAFLKLP
jgi:hypothetical protein